ncbi:hypothetical protein CR513_23688, partial [Mucuna pruriens]
VEPINISNDHPISNPAVFHENFSEAPPLYPSKDMPTSMVMVHGNGEELNSSSRSNGRHFTSLVHNLNSSSLSRKISAAPQTAIQNHLSNRIVELSGQSQKWDSDSRITIDRADDGKQGQVVMVVIESIRRYGTSSLNRHIEKCKKIKFEDVDMQGKLKSRKIYQMISHNLCVALVLKHDLPKELRSWIKYLNPDATPISRNTAKANVLRIYEREEKAQRRNGCYS